MKTKNNKTKKGGKKKELTAFEKAFSAARKKGKAELTWKVKKYNTRTFEDDTWDTIEHGPAINKKQEKTRNKRIAKQIAKRSKYQQGGGMYAENVMPAGLGSTAMTVYQESNPALQQQRMQALEAQKSKAIEETEAMAKEIEESKAGDAAKIREAKDMGTAQVEAGLGIGTQGLQIADEAGLLGKGTMTAAEQSAKDKQSLVGALKSAKNIYSATRAAKKTMKTVEGFNKAKMAFDMKRRLDMGEKAWKFQQSVKNTKQALESAKTIAKSITDALGGYGVFGVELFVKYDEVWFSEVSPRPHDTGLVTLISQDLSEFALHTRAILNLPIPNIVQHGSSASHVIKPEAQSDNVSFSNLRVALQQENTQIRLFGKPNINGKRRMGVVVCRDFDLTSAREKAKTAAESISITI